MPLYHFTCKSCDVIFEDFSAYDGSREQGDRVVPVRCSGCDGECHVVWIKPPGMAGDENISSEEKVAAALRLGFHADGRLSVPSTRAQLRRIRESLGDFRVGEKELLTSESKPTRSEAERLEDKRQTIEFIRERRARLRGGSIPRSRDVEPEVAAAASTTPLAPTRILADSTRKLANGGKKGVL